MAETRKIAAILAADVAGFSRLTGSDEDRTLARLRALRSDLIDPTIAVHNGRVVKRTGDGVLVEFRSVVDAVRCAVEVQNGMVERNAGLPLDRRIDFRIGIHLGDVVEESDGDLMGDGVNIAARLEGIAKPGAICLSEDAYRQVKARLNLAVSDLGATQLKNIAEPIRVYSLEADVTAQTKPEMQKESPAPDKPLAGLASPDKPSIAVLPFQNMSGEPEQEFFADGITEDILTELSRFRGLLVISRNSVFAYKGKAINVRKVAKELSVQYVVEGSVRKSGNRIRVTVQLIDAETDRHLWADRYDRELADIFAIQDEVTSSIVSILPGRVAAAAQDRVQRKRPENLVAYECVLAGKLLHHRSTQADNEEALRILERAIALDPGYARAHAWKACVLGQSTVTGWCGDVEATRRALIGEVTKALSLDENDSDVHRVLAAVNLTVHHDYDKALYHQERALALNPNDDLIVVQQGEVLSWIGQAEEGIEWIQKAMRLNPYHPENFWSHLGRAYFVARRYGEAVKAFKRRSRTGQTHWAFLAACHAQLGDAAAAKGATKELLQRAPDFSIERFIATQHYKHESDREHHRAALAKARLPA